MKYAFFCLIFVTIFAGCSSRLFRQNWLQEKSPESFKARFETTKGKFEIEAHRNWSPQAVDRLYQLIRHGYFYDIPLYRVEQDFVVQFGSMDSVRSAATWDKVIVPDEPVLKSNLDATISFARSGKDSRSGQLFINMKDNPRLDTIRYMNVTGFPVVAVVLNGMENIRRLYSHGLGMPPMPDSIRNQPMPYIRKHYPQMDYIKKVYIVH